MVYPVLRPSSYRRLLVLGGGVSGFALGAAVVGRWPQLVGWGLAGLLLEYGFSLVGPDALDPGAPLYAASLLVLGELVASIAGAPIPIGTGRHRYEVSRLSVIALGGAVASGFVMTVVWLLGRPGATGQLIGVVAAGIALVALVRLVQRQMAPSP